MAVDHHLRTNQRGNRVLLLPVGIADDRDGAASARCLFLGQKRATARQWHTENGEVIRTNNGAECAARVTLFANPDERQVESHHVAENSVLLANVPISRIRKTAISFRVLFIL